MWLYPSLYIGSSTDYTPILSVLVEVEGNVTATIELRTTNDDITLEYNDTVLLVFTPDESDLIESEGEYIRKNVTVYIIDNDRKLL